LGMQGAQEEVLGRFRLVAVARSGAPKAAGVADLPPVGGTVERAVEMARIDEGFQQQQRIAEAFLPIPNQAPFAPGEDAGGKIRIVVVGEDQEAAVVGDEMQAIIRVAEIPTDPGIPRATLPGGGGEAQQDHPLARPGSDVPQRMTNLRQCPQVMMRLHQALEAFLLESSHRLQMNFAVQAYGLGQLNVETLYTLATIPCPEPMTTY